MEASSSLLILTENHTQHSKDMIQQANQPSIATNVANFTDTDLQPVDMIPSKDPGNDFTTHGYSSLPPEFNLYSL